MYTGYGTGAQSPATSGTTWSDPDYFGFTALAGDVVSVAVATPDSAVNPYVELRNSADGVLSSDDNSGADTDAFISHYTITTSGDYFVRIGKNSSSTVSGDYQLRVDIARGINLESDAQYANDSISGADLISLPQGGPGHAVADVSGTIMAAESANSDEDYFSLGILDPGNTVTLTTQLPALSTLDGKVRIVDSSGTNVVDTDGNPNDDSFTGTITTSDEYYAVVEANSGAGPLAQYLLNIDIADTVAPRVVSVTGLPVEGATSEDVISSLSLTFSERMNPATVLASATFGLLEAGTDGVFETGDDLEIVVNPGSTFNQFSRSITLLLEQGPLASGLYRFSVDNSVEDRAGNRIDGNADGTGGDSFFRTFTLDLPATFVLESPNNDTLGNATALPLNEDPVGDGLYLGFGLGSIDPSNDLDWWSFEAEAGDRVGIAVDTPNSGIAVGPRLYNSAGTHLTSGFGAGPDNDGYISHYVVPSSGTYYVRLERWTNDSVGSYELRVELARGIDLESDQSYNNDSRPNADFVSLVQNGNQRSGTVAGTIMDREGTNRDEDYFQLGLLNAGNQIDLALTLPSSSTLVSQLRVFHADGTELPDGDSDPTNGYSAVVTTDGEYYALVNNDYWVRNGHAYELLGSLNWANAEAAAIARGGHLVTIDDADEDAFLGTAFGSWNNWIGLHDATGTNTFEWVDGTPVSFTNWNSGEPNTSSYDGAYKSTNGKWYDYSKGNALNGIVEWTDPLGRSFAGPGPRAQYILDITVSDPVPPIVTGVSRLPNGGTTSELISTFNVTVSEDLKASTVNTPLYPYAFNPTTGNTYVLAGSSQTWNQAEAEAQSLGGHLVTIDDQPEQDWLQSTFGGYSNYFYIGLSDQDVEGDWSTWADGTPVSFESWAGGYPRTSSNDFGYWYLPGGYWADVSSTTSSSYRGLIEIPGTIIDTDSDGTPDPFDSHPNDPLNGWDLREAGVDGIFDSPGTPSSDDVIYDLRLASTYSSGVNVSLQVYNGPLPEGNYRLLVTPSITDVVGNPLDGNSDGVGGDPYTRFFTVDLPTGFAYEGQSNDTLATATPLTLVEDPTGLGLYLTPMFGLGSIDPSNDLDWWSFEAEAGDRVGIAVDTPNSGIAVGPRLYNSAGTHLTSGFGAGPDNDGYISHYVIPSTGTYYVRLERWTNDSVGSYELRVELARGIDLESDVNYNNDSTSGADQLTYSTSGNQRNATVAGTIMSGESGNVDEDYFALGTVEAGETVFSKVTLPSISTLNPIIEIRDSGNFVVSVNPNPTDASIARYDILTTGQYFVVILGQGGQGPDGQYLLDVTAGPTSELQFADLSVTDITLPSPATAIGGDTVTIGWTAGNFGTAETDESIWYDRVVLSANDIYGDDDDIYLGSKQHTGSLQVNQTYTTSLDVTLPLDSDGLYYIFVETDELSDVFEFTLTDNNMTRSTDQLDVTLALLPDLLVEDLAISAPVGGDVTVNWTSANRGTGTAAGGFTERILVRNETTNTVVLDTTQPVVGDLAADGSLARSRVVPVTTAGNYSVTITTDFGGAHFEHNPSGHLNAEQNNSTQSFFDVLMDLTVENLSVTPSSPQSGNQITIEWDTTNTGNIAANASFRDRVLVVNTATGATLVNTTLLYDPAVTGNGAILPGTSRTRQYSLTLPNGLPGVGLLSIQVTTDSTNTLAERNLGGNAESNNVTTTSVTSTIAPYPDLQVANLTISPSAGVQSGNTITVSWDVLNDGDGATHGSFYDRISIVNTSTGQTLRTADLYYNESLTGNGSILAGQSRNRQYSYTLPNGSPGVGDISVTVTTDYYNQVFEYSSTVDAETNNAANTTFASTIAPYPDLQVSGLGITPASGVLSGTTINVSWNVDNTGSSSAGTSFYDRVLIVNTSTGMTLRNAVVYYDVAANGPIAAGSSTARQYSYTLPAGDAGVGTISVTVTTDTYSQVFEVNGTSDAETNNAATTSFESSIASAADLVITNLGVVPSPAESGNLLTISWDVENIGNLGTASSFYDRVVIRNTSTGATLRTANVYYDQSATGNGSILAGQSRARQYTYQLPDGSAGTGNIEVTVTTDYFNTVYEYNAGGTGESNNPAVTTLTSTIADYPDLQVTDISVPSTGTAGQPLQVTWTVTNNGTAAATNWTDSVYLSPDALIGSDTLLGSTAYVGTLAAGASLIRTQQFSVPLFFSGAYRAVLRTDASNGHFETNEANNASIDDADVTFPLTLDLKFNKASVSESGSGNTATATITRNGPTTSALTVTLSSSDVGEATVPTTIVIPAGAASKTFLVTGAVDSFVDGTQSITITGTAAGFAAGTKTINVTDSDEPRLSLAFAPASVTEGQSTTVTLTRNTDTTAALDVMLSTTLPGQVTFPHDVQIPAGSVSTTFTISAVDDEVAEGDNSVGVIAAATGFLSGTGFLTVLDNDTPQLSLSVVSTVVSEGASNPATTGIVTRSIVSSLPITVRLSTSHADRLSTPVEVTIPANSASSDPFPLNVHNNSEVDGDQTVIVSAFNTDALLGLAIAAGSTTFNVLLTDDDGPTLTVTLQKSLVREDAANPATTGTVRRNTGTTGDLTVTLASSDTSEATLPLTTVVIPNGANSVQFDVHAVQDGTPDGLQNVTISASATGFSSGAASLAVTDVDLPDLMVEQITAPSTPLANAQIPISYRVVNSGLSAAEGNWTDRVYLSTDTSLSSEDILLNSFAHTDPLPVDGFYENSFNYFLPSPPGTYYVIVKSDVDNSVVEGQEGNNVRVVDPAVEVLPDYTATLSADSATAVPGTPITFTGTATKTQTGLKAPFEFILVRVVNGGFTRRITAFTDADGNFQAEFNPLQGEGGLYQVGASHPGVDAFTAQDTFTVLGAEFGDEITGGTIQALATTVSKRVIPGQPVTSTIELKNLSAISLTGLTAVVSGAPSFLDVDVEMADALPGSSLIPVTFTLSALEDTLPTQGTVVIRVYSAEGTVSTLNVRVDIRPFVARPVANPGSLNRGMLRGGQTMVTFEVSNLGGADTGPMEVQIPDIEWLSLASDAVTPSLAPGQSTTVTLQLTPSDSLALLKYSGQIVLVGTGIGANVTVPFNFTAISDMVGDLLVTVEDELTYFGEGAPNLAGARVQLINPITGQVDAEAITGPDGQALLQNVPEREYELRVSATQHGTFRAPYTIVPGVQGEKTVFIQRQTVSYDWTVVETEIKDVYKIVLESTFVTNVPVPVVTVDEPFRIPLVVEGQKTQMDIKMTNHGLIQVEDVQVQVPTNHPFFKFTPLIDKIDVLPAKTTMTIPVTIELKEGISAADWNNARAAGLSAEAQVLQNAMDQALASGDFVGKPVDFQPNLQVVNTGIDCLNVDIKVAYKYVCDGDKWRAVPVNLEPLCTSQSAYNCLKDAWGTAATSLPSLGGNLANAPCALIGLALDKLTDLTSCQKALLKAACGAVAGGLTGGPAGALLGGLSGGGLGLLNCFCGLFGGGSSTGGGGSGGGGGGFSGYGGGPGNPYVVPTGYSIPTSSGCSGTSDITVTQDGVRANGGENGVCAQVRLRIEQEAVLTRTAFEGTLEITNGHTDIALTDVEVLLDIRDHEGVDSSDKFNIRILRLEGIGAVDGTGVVPADGVATIVWQFIPRDTSVQDQPAFYTIGGTFSYVEDGVNVEVEMLPAGITVQPDANLELRYFHQRDVYSDDPHTEEIEPAEPFELGLLVTNVGHGTARQLSITSSQPEIIENEKGLLIDFQIIGSTVGNQEVTPSLTVNLGDIDPAATQVASWQLTSTLQGRFQDFTATFEHVTGMGDDRLSLISSVEIHELNHTVRANRDSFDTGSVTDDDLPDFLVNDISDPDVLPDTLYLSDGSVAAVDIGQNAIVDGPAVFGDLQVELTIDMVTGWNYTRLPDPGSSFILSRVLRSDGKELAAGPNAWQTNRVFAQADSTFTREERLHIFDYSDGDQTQTYTLFYKINDSVAPELLDIVDVSPDPRDPASPVGSIDVEFSEQIDLTTFTFEDLTLTLNDGANLIDNTVTVSHLSAGMYRINGLGPLTTTAGVYRFSVNPGGILDFGENTGVGSAFDTWRNGSAPAFIESITGATPVNRNTAVDNLAVEFSEEIDLSTFDFNDITLTRNGSAVALNSSVMVIDDADVATPSTYLIVGLTGFTTLEGNYQLTVNATGVQKPASGVDGIGSESVAWTMDTTAPTVTEVVELATNPRNTTVLSMDVIFSEPISLSTFTREDLQISRNGGPNLIAGDSRVQVTHVSGSRYKVSGINWVLGAEGTYTFLVNASGVQDLAGNAGTGVSSTSWVMDTTKPVVPTNLAITPDTGILNTDGLTKTTTVTINGSLSEAGLNVRLTDVTRSQELGYATVTGTSFTHPLNLGTSGLHKIRARAIDAAGNVADSFFDVFVDLTAPTLALDPVSPNPTSVAVNTLTFQASELLNATLLDTSDLMLVLDGTPIVINPALVTVSGTGGTGYQVSGLSALTGSPGLYTLTIKGAGVEDLAGNAVASDPSVSWQMQGATSGDTTPPISSVNPLPALTADPLLELSWTGQDEVGGSGIASFDIYVSIDGGDYTVWLSETTDTSGSYTGTKGHSYAFFSVARDQAGNVEALPATADAQTTILGYAGINVTPVTELLTTESGGTATFQVALTNVPTADVTIQIESLNLTEGTVSVTELVFTTTNWNIQQPVTVTGVDDPDVDGDIVYQVKVGPVTSDDPAFAALAAVLVSLTNQDNDTPGVQVTPTSGLQTTEAGGTATFDVVLKAPPTAAVTIPLSSDNLQEGSVPTEIVFTTSNWNVPQTVTITGVNDDIDDGDIVYNIVLGATQSSDPNYVGINPADVSVTNVDDDATGVTVTPTSGLTTTESGGTAQFQVYLNSEPTADVVIAVASNNTVEGTVTITQLTFTSANWDVPQEVTVTGADDNNVDGDILYTINLGPITSSDALYAAIDPPNVLLTNEDNDSTVVPPTVSEVVVQNDMDQRSYVDTLEIRFDHDMDLAGAITDGSITSLVMLTNLGVNADVDADQVITTTPSQYLYSFDATTSQGVLTWSLDSFANTKTSLPNGYYELRLSGSILDSTGVALDGDLDDQPGGDFTTHFHRLYADLNGDLFVNTSDITIVNLANGSVPGRSNWNPNADLDRNGQVNIQDRIAVLQTAYLSTAIKEIIPPTDLGDNSADGLLTQLTSPGGSSMDWTQSLTSTLSNGRDIDWFLFEAPASGILQINISAAGGVVPRLTLFEDRGIGSLGFESSGTGSTLTAAVAGRHYFVRIDVGTASAFTNLVYTVSSTLSAYDDYYPLIGADLVRADSALSGAGYSVAIIDTGIDASHPALAGRVLAGWDFGDNDNDPTDTVGHGTQIAGLVASSDPHAPGIAPTANVIPLKITPDGSTSASIDAIASALLWVLDHRIEFNIAAVNISFGAGNVARGTTLSVLEPLYQQLFHAGVFIASSAGNSYFGYGSAPGVNLLAASYAVTAVGAVWDSNAGAFSFTSGAQDLTTGPDRLTSFTQRGDGVDLLAPGGDITLIDPSGQLVVRHGTSMSSPIVAGASILLREAIDRLGLTASAGTLRHILEVSGVVVFDGDDENDNVINSDQYYSRLDIASAIDWVYDHAAEIEGWDSGLPGSSGGSSDPGPNQVEAAIATPRSDTSPIPISISTAMYNAGANFVATRTTTLFVQHSLLDIQASRPMETLFRSYDPQLLSRQMTGDRPARSPGSLAPQHLSTSLIESDIDNLFSDSLSIGSLLDPLLDQLSDPLGEDPELLEREKNSANAYPEDPEVVPDMDEAELNSADRLSTPEDSPKSA